METQGSRWQNWMYDIDELTISPKPPSSGMTTEHSVLADILEKLKRRNRNHHISLKIVVFNQGDYDFAKQIHFLYPMIPFYLQVGNDDLTTIDNSRLISDLLEKYHALIDRVMKDEELKAVKVLPQLHALVWGNKRGV